VSPEEIEAATAAALAKQEASEKKKSAPREEEEDENEWLPDELKRANKGSLKGRKGKKRR